MTIRAATFADIRPVLGLMHEMHRRSDYAGNADIDEKVAMAFLRQAIQRHGGKHEGATLFLVAQRHDGELEGFVVGVLQRTYLVLNVLTATDFWTYATMDARPSVALGLVRGFVNWARSVPEVVDIDCAVTDAISADPDEVGRIYEAFGFAKRGNFYRRRLT